MIHKIIFTTCAVLFITFAYSHTAQADNTATAGEPQTVSTENQCDKTWTESRQALGRCGKHPITTIPINAEYECTYTGDSCNEKKCTFVRCEIETFRQ